MGGLPSGVVTFVFTDIEGSTRLWDDASEVMMEALIQHDEVVDRAVEEHNGVSVKPRGEGDSRFLVFEDAVDAVCAACSIQKGLAEVEWVTPKPLRVRASVHTGTADLQLGDYYGSTVNRAARLRSIAHGGQTVMSGTTWELVRDSLPEYVSLRDMGEHALKDLTRPEHVYQVATSELTQDFPPLVSLNSTPNNLPRQLTEFVGRGLELEKAKELLEETRLLTILAPGGSGKTRLAIQAAADIIEDYPDGVFFISLAEINTGSEIVQAAAESIGVSLASEGKPEEQLLRYLAPRRLLLVFDNFEHVAYAAELVSEILRSTDEVSVVVTSRAKLNLQGEVVLPLGGLDTSWSSDEEALASSGVRLFLDTAKRSDPAFALANHDLAHLEQILSVTGGLPLGIILAASWVDMLPLAEIATEVQKSLDFLETEMGDIPDRHRSVRAVFDYSWDLLSESERLVFTGLAVFRGGFTREAASQVAGASIRDLATLASKSLITTNEEKTRYFTHELLRQFAHAELLSNPDRAKSIDIAHASYFAGLGETTLDDFLMGNQIEILATWERDLDNLREAWRCINGQQEAELARKLINALVVFHEIRGWYQSGLDLWAEALKSFPDYDGTPDNDVVRASAICAQVYYRTLMGEPDPGPAKEALRVLRPIGTPEETFIALQGLAISDSYSGQVEDMIATTEEMMEIGTRVESGLMSVGGRNWRSLAALMEQDVKTGREILPLAEETLRRIDDHYYLTWTLAMEAMVAGADNDVERAITLLSEQVEISRAIGYRRGLMTGLGGLGEAHLAVGNVREAQRAFIEAIANAEAMGIRVEMLGFMFHTAKALALEDQTERAVEILSTVAADPESTKQNISDTVTVKDKADELLEELATTLDDESFVAMSASGRGSRSETVAKQLIDSLR